MPATPYFEGLIFDYAIRGEPFVITSWWLALYTSSTDPGPGNEITSASYARQLVTWTGNVSALDITFPQYNSVSSTVIRSLGLCDTLTSGNLLTWRAISPTITLANGNVIVLPAGSITLDLLNA